MTNVGKLSCAASCVVAMIVSVGCNSPAGMAVQLVGKAVDSVEADNLGKELIGQGSSAADQKLGQRIDTWRQVNGSREWCVYPVGMDVLGNQRYVVQVANNRVVAITKVKMDGSGIDLAKKLMYDQKVKGKSPRECEDALGMGEPLVTARSEKTRSLCQLYDAKLIADIGSPQYCKVHFDANDRCDEVAIVDVGASTKSDPTQ